MDENLNELIIATNNLNHYPRLTNHLTVTLEHYIFPVNISCFNHGGLLCTCSASIFLVSSFLGPS
jgi:hypothetical protein